MPIADKIPAKLGRPSTFQQSIADEVCERIAGGESLRSICRDEHIPHINQIFRWMNAYSDFREQYAHARESQADAMAEEILQIADDGSNDTYTDAEGRTRTDTDVVQRSRLRVEARKWLMAKMHPKKYGENASAPAAQTSITNYFVPEDLAVLQRYAKGKLIEHDPAAKLLPKE